MAGYSLSSTVRLKVTAPPTILKTGHLIRVANLSQTWAQFLNEVCGLQVSKEDGVIVRNLYSPRGRNGQYFGWMAELDEEIGVFVSKYEQSKGQYTVRVTKKRWITTWNDAHGQSNVSGDNMDLEEGEVLMPTGSAVNFRRTSVKTEETGACGGDEEETEEGDQLTINNVRSLLVDASDLDMEQLLELNNEEEEQDSVSISEEMEVEDDIEEIKVEQESIVEPTEEDLLKMLVAHNVGRYSNTFMMRVKRELQALQGSNEWARNVKRSPLSCYLIQALFQV